MTSTPEFLLADNTDFPDSIFVIHTSYPRFIIDLSNDEIDWWESFSKEDREIATEEMAHWIEKATNFYDREVERLTEN